MTATPPSAKGTRYLRAIPPFTVALGCCRSSQEIGHAVADVQNAVKAGSVSPQDVNAHLLQQQLYTKVNLKFIC